MRIAMKIRNLGTIAAALAAQNRWLILLLVAWPWVFLALLIFPEHNFSPDDIRALLQQEYFYGVALTMILAASLFGAELRARRVTAILCHAVSRDQYLASLWLTALLPAVLFALSVFLSVWLTAGHMGFSARMLAPFILNLLLAELWMVLCGVLFSLFLPALLASLATGLIAAALAGISGLQHWVGHTMAAGLGSLMLSVYEETNVEVTRSSLGLATASVLVQVILLGYLSQQIFRKKDLPSSGE